MRDATESIYEANQKRHNHYDESNVNRCDKCGNFLSLPEPEAGKIQTVCNNCGRSVMKYVGSVVRESR